MEVDIMGTDKTSTSKADNVKTALRTFKDEIGWWVGLASGILSFIEYKLDNIPAWIKVTCFVTCTLAFVLCLFKLKRFLINTFEKYNKPLEQLSNEYSDKMNQLEKRSYNISEGIAGYLKIINLNKSTTCNDICIGVKDVFSALWPNYTVSVSIKAFDPDSTKLSFENWKILTLGRSNNAASDRSEHDQDKDLPTVSNNSDFKIILSPKFKDTAFMCKDLSDPAFKQSFREEYDEDYSNSTPRYWDKYSSTIVVPIRKPDKNGDFLIIGFLCVDTKEPFLESDLLFSSGEKYLSGFAAMLYSFILNPEN